MSVRSVFLPAAVFQSATPADRTSRRSSSVVVRACTARACVLAWRGVPRKARMRAGVARRAAKRKRKECRPKKDKSPKQEKCCMRAAWLGSAIAAALLCVRSEPSDASHVQGARATPNRCRGRGGNCRCVLVCCAVPAVTCGSNMAAGTSCACASSCSGRVNSGGVWQCGRRWPAASS